MYNDESDVSRGAVVWPLLFLVYLFLVANNLFTGMFNELQDRAGHTYRPEDGADIGEAVAALLFTAGPLLGWLWWRRGNADALAQIGGGERLIVRLLVALVGAATLRNMLVLALRLDAMPDAIEIAILGMQIAASVILIGGGLSLLNRNLQDGPDTPLDDSSR